MGSFKFKKEMWNYNQTILSNIKATLKKNISLKDISDISGKSIEKIKEVEKSIQ